MERNTVVLASAGTGKTRKLVETYLELIEDGADPLRIAAVTFTEKAAAEMRDRIRTALYAKDERWMRTIAALPAAPISTIHGFCGILLREHGLELGVDPAFTILDEQRRLDLAREAARETIREEIRSGNEDVETLFGDFGLERLVEAIVSAGYWIASLGVDAEWLQARVEDQQRAAGIIEAEIEERIREYGGDFERIGELADELEAKKARHPLRKRDDPGAVLPRIGQIAGVAAAAHLSRLAGRSLERFKEKKRAMNGMDFDDLLLGVRDLLRNHTEVRRAYQNHFQALLIDEFQDTDEVQAEIITLLAGDAGNPDRLSPRKLMVVGDPKQSIYRFRRARVTVFFKLLDRIVREGGAVVHLQENHRSAPPLAEFSNRISQVMMDGSGKAPISDPDVDLSYRIRFNEKDLLKAKSEAPFLGITYVASETGVRASEGREMEAEAIARLLKEWKSSGRIQSWKEVAMLLRAMTNVEVYLGAMEAHGIPVYVVQGTAFYQKTEVSDLIAFLELVLHPGDELLKATVLTSSLFGLGFSELAGDSGRGTRGRGVRPAPPRIPCEQILEDWIERRDSATAAEILQDVIRKTNFDVVMMAQKNGRQRVANIGKLIEITRGLARQGTTALDDTVRFLRDRAHDASIREQEAQVAGQDDDVVRVLSVHQAKGLEFDIVIVPDLAAKAGRPSGDRTFFSDRWGILVGRAYGLHRKALPHSLILEAKELEDDQQYEEEKRLLYVALTRARKMLVLGEGFSRQTGPWLPWLERVFEAAQPGALQKARDGKTQTVKFKGFSAKVLPASQLNVPEQLAFSAGAILVGEPHIALSAEPRLVPALEMTPSDLASLAGCFRFFYWNRLMGREEPGPEPAGGMALMRLGSLAHKLLETGTAPSAEALAAFGLADLGPVLESSDWRELRAAEPEREMPFMMHLNVEGKDCWIRGRMDAVVPAGIARVIDYKYAAWRDGFEADYDVQMTAYSLALMKALGTDRAVSELWYLRPPMKIIRREHSFREAEDRLRVLLLKYVMAIEADEWPMADRTYCDRVECGFRQHCWSGN